MKHSLLQLPAVVLAATLLVLPACQRPEEPLPPATLLSKHQMVSIMVDLHLLEARVENAKLSSDSARALFLAQQKELLWNRQVSDSVFYQSFRYYSIHGKDMDEIYTTVIDSLAWTEAQVPKP